jgi:hypothetical protein
MGLDDSFEYNRVMYSPIIPKQNKINPELKKMATINEV